MTIYESKKPKASVSFQSEATSGTASPLDSAPVSTPDVGSDSSHSPISSNDASRNAENDPPVVVGMACRLPGATNTSELWKVLAAKADLQRKMPENRFNVDSFYHPQGTNKGTTNARFGYFLDQDLDEFDAQFFGISGKEAEAMDPQQRLLLEVVYEALENAGIPMESASGSQTAVFCGSFSNDYLLMTQKDLVNYPKYTVTGTGNAVISNRISYCFNLHGPSVTIDTACSSSLVCFHMACESLKSGECDMAIVCGSALHFDPSIFITMTDFGMLSSDGRCRTFDARGSGYVRGEGICAIVLKKQQLAEACGDRIRAVVRANSSNHDGSKEGLTLPNDKAQEMLLRQTYAKAQILTADTQYFEAHGTGTAAGDPREVSAIANVFASERDTPLLVGSIKSNLGHTEGASGTAGIIKTVLSLEAGKILPNMHFEEPNPKIDFRRSKVVVPTTVMDWPTPRNGVCRASINSFGYGGSNAHVVLEKYVPRSLAPGIQQQNSNIDRPFLLPLTSHSEEAGALLSEKLAAYLEASDDALIPELASTLSNRRSMHNIRSFAIGASRDSVIKELRNPRSVALWRRRHKHEPRLGFVFTGQGAQWYAMGRDLIENCPEFLQTLRECDKVLQNLPDAPSWSCVDELLRSADESQLSRSSFSQPLCAAIQLAIVQLLSTWGIKPNAVVGHSSGEIVAAYAAGILSFDNSIICAYYRGLHMSKGTDSNVKGAMMAVGLTETEAMVELESYNDRIVIAAVNSASSLTLSGDEDAIIDLKAKLDERKVFARQLQVEQAFHSHHMVPLAPAFREALSRTPGFTPTPATVPMFSSVTARNSSFTDMDGLYWATNMIGQVKFSDAMTEMLLDENEEARVDALVEIGAHPALKGPSKQTMKALNLDLPYLGSLDRNSSAYESMLSCAGELFSLGYPVDLDRVNMRTRTLHDLPTYAWNHGKYWAETRLIREHRQRSYRHTLLGAPVPGAPANHLRFRNYLRQSEIPWLAGHMIDGKVIFPAAGYISMAIEAVSLKTPRVKEFHLKDVSFKAALTIPDAEEGTEVILDLIPQVTSAKSTSSVWSRFEIFSFDATGKTVANCHGLILAEAGEPASLARYPCTFAEAERATTRSQAIHNYYERLMTAGLQYGHEFRLLHSTIESGDGFAVAPLTFQPAMFQTAPSDACIVHPTMLDASFHAIFGAIESQQGRTLDDAFVPTFIRNMKVGGFLGDLKAKAEPQNYWIRSEAQLPGSRVANANIDIVMESTNELALQLTGFELTALGNEAAEDKDKRWLFYRSKWLPAFSHLGKNVSLRFQSITEVLASYLHQYPDSRVLHLSSEIESSCTVARALIDQNNGRRLIKSIAVLASSNQQEVEDAVQKICPDLLTREKPESKSFNLVIVSGELDGIDANSFMADGGHIIFNSATGITDRLSRVFDVGKFSAWRTALSPTLSSEATILVSPQVSTKTQALIESIQKFASNVSWQIINVDDLEDETVVGQTILSLISLDEDVFFEQPRERSRFLACQKLFASKSMNMVWLLSGAALDTPRPAQALALGLFRTVRNENESLRLTSLDIPMDYDAGWIAARTLDVLSHPLGEDELVERDGTIFIQRIIHDDALNAKLPNGGHRQPRLEPFIQNRKLALKIGKVGLLDTLRFEDDEQVLSELHPDDLEIEVKASALNFRDIAASIGIIDDYRLGDECSGVVSAIGANYVGKFRIGDRVACWCPGQGSHRRFNRVKADYCHPISKDMDMITASCIYGVTTTAYYSLIDIARLQPGEYCLVHAGAGGVGQQAIQIAQMIGAKVIATCGAQAKRDYLKQAFGLTDDHIFSSRDSSFVEGVLKITGGRGVDVALNSLAGELLHATWSCIAPFGRMIEIGKRDIHENSHLNMDPFRKNISYCSVDLITIHNLNRTLGARLMRDAFRIFEEGKIKPPGPIEVVSYTEVQKGFRLLQMGKFFGKVCLVPSQDDLVPVVPPVFRNTQLFSPDKVYLLVGGLGGIGRALSQWALRKGARKLAFLSRSGDSRSDARATVEWLVSRGVNVSVFKADVANSKQVHDCIATIGSSLGGIFHAAMVLQDCPFQSMSFEQWQKCVEPKVRGAYNLHEATIDKELEFFITFSSGSAIIGATGQSNYSSANCYLDALMKHRRQNGLVGFTMNVGRVGGVGVVAENEELNRIMDRMGYDVVNEEELFWQIEEAVRRSPSSSPSSSPQTSFGVEDHQLLTGLGLVKQDVYWTERSRFRNIYRNHDFSVSTANRSGKSLHVKLRAETNIDKRGVILQEAFLEKIAAVLAAPLETIQPANPLSLYGLDSIVAVEFRKWFSGAVGVELALFDILSAKSIEALVGKVNSMINVSSVLSSSAVAADHMERSTKQAETHTTSVNDLAILPLKLDPSETGTSFRQSSFQTRMWYSHNTFHDPANLNFAVIIDIQGNPSLELLQRSLDELVRRNQTLRTAYSEGDEYSEQRIMDHVSYPIEYIDLSSKTNIDEALKSHVSSRNSIPLDIVEGENIRSSLIKKAPSDFSFILNCHHICMDGGSSASALTQIVEIYSALRSGQTLSSIRPPRYSYIDFTLWHRQLLESPAASADLGWWTNLYANAPAAMKLLPFAKAERPSSATRERSIVYGALGISMLKRLKRVCSRMDVTPTQFAFAAFRSFIWRYTQEDDLTFLLVDGSRPHSSLEDVIGFFVNMLPVRMRSDYNVTFDSVLKCTKTNILDSLAHSQVPFDEIVHAVVPRSAGRTHSPIGQVAVNYQIFANAPKLSTPDFKVMNSRAEDIPTACDLALEVIENPDDGLHFRLEYDSYLYGHSHMQRFIENFTTFFKHAVIDFRQPVREILMCGEKELQYIRQNCSNLDAQIQIWKNGDICSRVAAMASQRPAATAIKTSDNQTITYAELLAEGERQAMLLKEAGITAGQAIGIYADPCIAMVASMYAAARLRCPYVPLDTQLAESRMKHMLVDSAVVAILTDNQLAKRCWALTGDTIRIITFGQALKKCEQIQPTQATADDVFYILYTSGSTGKPKGVSVTHENLQILLSNHQEVHQIGPEDRLLFQSTMSFDVSVAQIWGALSAGATICLAKKEIKTQPVELASFMKTSGTTITFSTPSEYAVMLEHAANELRGCRNLRVAALMGEHLPPRVAAKIYELGLDITVVNEYGPTETVIVNTSHKVRKLGPNITSIPVGKPFCNNSVYIVDDRLQPVPSHVIGEICFGGAQISAGYINRPEATAKSFAVDPFSSHNFKEQGWTRMYRTGDVGFFNQANELEITGRISDDRQVKLRGYRLDLAEVENEIFNAAKNLDTSASIELTVLLRGETSKDGDGRQLIAFIGTGAMKTTSEQQRLVNDIQEAISRALNSYMLPNGYQFLQTLPKLISGKIDRQVLFAKPLDPIFPVGKDSTSQVEQEAIGEDVQTLEIVTEAFRNVLKLPVDRHIAPNTNFFELGGQSILLLRLQAQLKKKLNARTPLLELFSTPTPLGVSLRILGRSSIDIRPVSAPTSAVRSIDWDAEVKLDDSIKPSRRQQSLNNNLITKEVVLIGAETFAGVQMLNSILVNDPTTVIHTIGSEVNLSFHKLVQEFEDQDLFRNGMNIDLLQNRIKITPGNLKEKHFGLDTNDFRALAANVSAIYHFGGHVSLLKSYSDLARINVGSVKDCIELASLGTKDVQLHYLSTWSVAHLQKWTDSTFLTFRTQPISDETTMAHYKPSSTDSFGYFKSKWTAEMVVGEAARRGFHVSIYRTSAVTASLRPGIATPDDNFTQNVIAGVFASSKVPRFDDKFDIDFIPIDYAAEVIFRLSTSKANQANAIPGRPQVFHVSNPKPLSIDKLPELAAKMGRPVTVVPIEDWLRDMQNSASSETARIEWMVVKQYMENGHRMFSLDQQKTLEQLRQTGDLRTTCPPVDANMISTMLQQANQGT